MLQHTPELFGVERHGAIDVPGLIPHAVYSKRGRSITVVDSYKNSALSSVSVI